MNFAKSAFMNKILFIVLLFSYSFVVSCQENNNSNDDKTEKKSKKQKSELEKKVSKRDYSITAANSFSDLFFDSLAMESYITENKLSDTLSRRMRSFYNPRNYQYAWFSTSGLTEQAYGFWNLLDYEVSARGMQDIRDKNLKKTVDQHDFRFRKYR